MFFKESKKSNSFLPMSLEESIIMKTAAQDQKVLCGDFIDSNTNRLFDVVSQFFHFTTILLVTVAPSPSIMRSR